MVMRSPPDFATSLDPLIANVEQGAVGNRKKRISALWVVCAKSRASA
jgi:hypothetical protein